MTEPVSPDLVNAIVRNPDDPRYPSQITVFCDHCGVENTGDYLVDTGMTSTERLAVARQHLVANAGWEHTEYGDDFCPEHAGSPDEEQPAAEASAACGKCKQPFVPPVTGFEEQARYASSPYCRGCVDRCHDNEIAGHRCVICAEGAQR